MTAEQLDQIPWFGAHWNTLVPARLWSEKLLSPKGEEMAMTHLNHKLAPLLPRERA
jgi:hypothetical protein